MKALLDNLLVEAQWLLSTEQKQAQLRYVSLLNQWNQIYNLTAVRQLEQMLSRHIMDSLSVIPFLPEGDLLDVGSGAGLPGIPLAIAQPNRHYTLLDSLGKRTQFLTQVKQQLKLSNVSVVQDRVENFQTEQLFSGIICRAFSALPTLVSLCRHLIEPINGKILAMKGKLSEEELSSIPKDFTVAEIIPLKVPGLLDKNRHLVIVTLD